MGVVSDLLANARTIDTTLPREASQRSVYGELKALQDSGDYGYPSGYDVVNEVQSIAILDAEVDGGTFKLVFHMVGGETVTTGNIAFDAIASAIITAINSAFTSASYPGWVNGHIVATGGPLTTTPVLLTFSGASVAGKNHALTTVDGALLTDGGEVQDPYGAAITISTEGHTARPAWALLKVLGIVTSTPPAQGADLSAPTVGRYSPTLSAAAAKAVIEEAAIRDANATVRSVLLAALNLA